MMDEGGLTPGLRTKIGVRGFVSATTRKRSLAGQAGRYRARERMPSRPFVFIRDRSPNK